MEKCLVTKLKGTATGQGFEKLGALKIKIVTGVDDLVYIHFNSIANQTLTTDGNSYFINSSDNSNLGQEITLPAGRSVVLLSAKTGDNYIYFSNKAGVNQLRSDDTTGTPIWSATNTGFSVHINSTDLKYCTSLNAIAFTFNSLYGLFNLEDFKDLETNIFVLPDINTEVHGDIANIMKSNTFLAINLTGKKQVYGNLSSFAGKTVTSLLDLSETSIEGDIVALKGVSASQILLKDIPKLIFGNLGDLNNNTRFISFGNSANTSLVFNDWQNGARTKLLAVEGGFMEWGATEFIKKSGTLTLDSGLADYEKKINIKVNTFDYAEAAAALTSLRNKGVDVIINGVLVN